MTPTKQTVYLPVNGDYLTAVCTFENEWVHQETVVDQEGYFFTPEQLNEYTQSVIKQALETAAENAEPDYWKGDCQLCASNQVNKSTIINTFEETYKKFEV